MSISSQPSQVLIQGNQFLEYASSVATKVFAMEDSECPSSGLSTVGGGSARLEDSLDGWVVALASHRQLFCSVVLDIVSGMLVMSSRPHVLLLVGDLLGTKNFRMRATSSNGTTLRVIHHNRASVAVASLEVRPVSNLALFHRVRTLCPSVPIVLLATCTAIRATVRTVGDNVFSCVAGPFGISSVATYLGHTRRGVGGGSSVFVRSRSTPGGCRFRGFVTSSPMVLRIYSVVRGMTPATTSILVGNRSNANGRIVTGAVRGSSAHSTHP